MATKSKADHYAILVAEAEAAVAAVKDPELRRVAFDKILGTLLEGTATHTKQSTSPQPLPRTGRATATPSAPKPRRPRGGPRTYIRELIDDDFFKKQRTIAEVKAELANRGHHLPLTSLSGPLQGLTQDRVLRRQKAVGAEGKKPTFAYSNW